MVGRVIAKHCGDRHIASASARFQRDLSLHRVPAALESDYPGCEVYVFNSHCAQLAKPQPGVQGSRPDRMFQNISNVRLGGLSAG
jgi:hypothetical protein